MNRKDMITDDLTNKWNKGELTTPKYISALQEHATELEEQNQGLQSLLDLKQQEISVFESKVGDITNCNGCKWWSTVWFIDKCSSYKRGKHLDRYEPKQN